MGRKCSRIHEDWRVGVNCLDDIFTYEEPQSTLKEQLDRIEASIKSFQTNVFTKLDALERIVQSRHVR